MELIMKKILLFALLFTLPLMADYTEYKSIEPGKSVIKIYEYLKPIEIISETDGNVVQVFLKKFPSDMKVEFLRVVSVTEPSPDYDCDCKVELRYTTSVEEKANHEWVKLTTRFTQQIPIKIKTVKKLSSRKGKVLYKKGALRVIHLR